MGYSAFNPFSRIGWLADYETGDNQKERGKSVIKNHNNYRVGY